MATYAAWRRAVILRHRSRTLTALAEPGTTPAAVAAEPPAGYWEREASHFPQPLTPFLSSFWSDSVNAIWRGIASDLGMFIDGLDMTEIGGWMYTRLVPLGGKDRKAPPAPLMWLALRTAPAMRRRVRACIRSIREDLPGSFIERWYGEWRADQVARVAAYRAVDLAALSGEQLQAELRSAIAFVHTSFDRHFRLATPMATIVDLALVCEELLGWDERQALDLLAGLSSTSTEPARQLARLAAMAAERPAIRALLAKVDATTADRLEEVDTGFAAEFARYQHEFGFRALRYEVVDPTLAEVPALTLHLIHDQLVRGFNPAADEEGQRRRRENALAKAREQLAGRPQADHDRFERLLGRAERYYPVREENEFYTVSQPLAVLRAIALEAGRRLALSGQIAERDDVFFLRAEEITAALGDGAERRETVRRRRDERAWVLAHPGPASYGTKPAGPPPAWVFPSEVAFTIKAVQWSTERTFGATSQVKQEARATQIKGIGAAAGQYTGPARIILDESEFDKIEPGDVLVCPITSPVWSIIFPSVGALVTDTGGVLSHPAIIAREYGVPAVVATGNATEILRDGQQVMVDGAAGTVDVVGDRGAP